MNSDFPSSDWNSSDLPGREDGEFFSLEVFAELAGVNTRTVLHYQEQGFIRPVAPPPPPPPPATAAAESAESAPGTGTGTTTFDTEALRQLRRIEHLRETCGMNETGLRLILNLLHEVEQLRRERRRSPR